MKTWSAAGSSHGTRQPKQLQISGMIPVLVDIEGIIMIILIIVNSIMPKRDKTVSAFFFYFSLY